MRGLHDAIRSNFSCIKVFVECCSLLSHLIGLHCISLFPAGQVAGSLFTGAWLILDCARRTVIFPPSLLVLSLGMGADGSSTARVQRMLVHLVYLVYLVCLVDRTGNSFRRTRQTRKTGQPDRRARARCASTEDHQAPSLLPPVWLSHASPASDILPHRSAPVPPCA